MKPIALMTLLGVALLASCSGLQGYVRYAPRPGGTEPSSDPSLRPSWIHDLPQPSDAVQVVGESEAVLSKQEALEDAWANALLRLGLTQFPELSRVESRSIESLKHSDYRRSLTLRFEHIDWTGLQEVSQFGSPYIERTGNRYRAYRLLRWKKSAIADSRAQMKRNGLLDLDPPALSKRSLTLAHQSVNQLNRETQKRDRELAKIFQDLKCGVTVKNMIALLGRPDSSNPNNPHILQKDYRWGSFTAWRIGHDPRIAAVTRDGRTTPFKVVCPSNWIE